MEQSDGRIVLVRDASVISYGAQADAVVTTARRDADADASDQVLVVFEKKNYSLEKTGGWDTLGMRGTCSAGFCAEGRGQRRNRSCRCPMARSTARPWCPPRI